MFHGTFHFPQGFLWGAATAAHQVEGNNTNNQWSVWEQQAGRIYANQRAGLACDWWGGRWQEDLDRAADDGHNAHRLSIEWSRIQPTPDRWNDDALEVYRQILRGARERGLTPMVTLHHFTDPLWFAEQGGWQNAHAPMWFEAFVSRAAEALKEYVSLWVTINEPNVYTTGGYILGTFPPGGGGIGAVQRVLSNMAKGHAAAYAALHRLQPTAQVGVAMNYRSFVAARAWNPLDGWAAKMQHASYNDSFPRTLIDGTLRFAGLRWRIPQAAKTLDFLGINYYTRDWVKFDWSKPGQLFGRGAYRKDALLSDTGFIAHEPEGMYEALKWASSFGLPVYVTENGVEDADDHLRPRYLAEHIHQMWRAVNFNWRVRGYFHWTLVDNFEWERGWSQRFGLYALNVETQARRKRPSAELYAAICRENGLSSDMLAKYAPESLPVMFPG